MNMKQSCKALISAIEGELDGRHCTEEQAAAILDHALPSLTEALARAQSELAEAVGLLRYSQEIARLFDDEHTAEVGRFLSRHAQAEQQEAQGAQAGEFQREDRYIVIKRKDLEAIERSGEASDLETHEAVRFLAEALDTLRPHLPARKCLVIESDWPEYEPTWAAIQARAALATQPAAGEPFAWIVESPKDLEPVTSVCKHKDQADRFKSMRWTVTPVYAAPPAVAPVAAGEPVDGVEGFACWLIDHCEGYEIFEEKIQDWVADYLKSDAYQHVAAPPAAAHGDEAVRKDAERYRWIEPVFAGLFGIDSMDEYIDRAAMRAQAGEGGE